METTPAAGALRAARVERRSLAALAAVPATLFLFALAIRALLAALHPDPGDPDSAYYVVASSRR